MAGGGGDESENFSRVQSNLACLHPAMFLTISSGSSTTNEAAGGHSLAPVPPADTPSIATALLDDLTRAGVDHCYMIPGASIAALGAAVVAHPRIRPILAAHENGAVFMADGHARATGGLGLALVTGGPGGTNAATGVAVAFADHVPLVLLSGHAPLDAVGRGLVQESSPHGIDLVRVMAPVTLASALATTALSARRLLRKVIATATHGSGGPVHLSVPADIAARPAPMLPPTHATHRAGMAPDALSALVHALRAARSPAILAGNGVLRAGAAPALRAFAERTGIPVATSPMARGVFPERHPLSLGCLGYGAAPSTERHLYDGAVDLLLAIGTSLGESSTNLDARLAQARTFVHIDAAPAVDRWPITLPVQADAGCALEQLLASEALPHFSIPLEPRRPLEPCTELGHPAAAIDALERARLPREVLVSDAGNCFWWVSERATFHEPHTFLVNLGAGSMGYAVGASIGACIGRGGARTFGVLGDAAFLMSAGDVRVAVEEKLPIVWVVLNDGGHGMVWHGETLAFGRSQSPTRFAERIDAAGVARALGATGIRTTTDALDTVLAQARQIGGPVVVDVEISREFVPKLLERRVALVKSMQGAKS